MSAWLSKQKKPELQALADAAGLRGTSHMNKTDLIAALETRLRDQAPTLSANPTFEPFFNTNRANSPLKREPAAAPSTTDAPAEPEAKKPAAPRRRVTNVAPSSSTAASPSSTARALLPASTPSSVQRVAQALPASPKAVADLFERQSVAVSRSTERLFKATYLDEAFAVMRESLSTVAGITASFIRLEAYALQRVTLPLRHAFSVPVPLSNVLGIASPYRVMFPDFFVLLKPEFWNPTLLWLSIAIIFPAIFGMLFNLSRAAAVSHRRSAARQPLVDPVAFNIARGLMAWLVLINKFNAGFVHPRTIALVDASMWGGANAVIITSVVAATAGIYEAILRKS